MNMPVSGPFPDPGRRQDVGIEAISVYAPRPFLDLGTLAKARGVDPKKYYEGLGGRRIAVPEPDEDPVTMGVSAALSLFSSYRIDPAGIGLLIVGSESGVDCAKPIAVYLHGLLGLNESCRVFDTMHACYSATAALRVAADWCAHRKGAGKKALIIASDVARYDAGSPGEPTQGAGAVAMVVSTEPSVFSIDREHEAVYSRDVMDFWRPHYRQTALVDGHASIASYLDGLETTYRAYRKASGFRVTSSDFMMFHVPFPKMAQKGYRVLHAVESGGGGEGFERDFAIRTKPALWANREIGNIYSGSLYLSLAGLLESEGQCVESAVAGMFSYGSGCCAEFFSGRFGPDASAWRGRTNLSRCLERRTELTYAEYLDLREASEAASKGGIPPPGIPDRMRKARFAGIRDHKRLYERIDWRADASRVPAYLVIGSRQGAFVPLHPAASRPRE